MVRYGKDFNKIKEHFLKSVFLYYEWVIIWN